MDPPTRPGPPAASPAGHEDGAWPAWDAPPSWPAPAAPPPLVVRLDDDTPKPPADGPPSGVNTTLMLVVGGVLAGAVVFWLSGNLPTWMAFVILGIGPIVVYAVVRQHQGVLRREQVIDRWSALIVAGEGRGEQIIDQTVETLRCWRIPQISWVVAALTPGFLRGLAGDRRSFLVVTHTSNPQLKPFTMYVNARDYGATLQTTWFLAYRPSFWQRLLHLFGPVEPRLDLFDEQDLRAFVTAVHHAFLEAVVALLTALGQDANRLERSTKGFLGIS